MYNKYQRDKHLATIKDLTRRKMVTGYMRDAHFEDQLAVAKQLASPRRRQDGRVSPDQLRAQSLTPPPLTDAERLAQDLELKEKTQHDRRRKRTIDLANRSKMRMQSWLGRLDFNTQVLHCKYCRNLSLSIVCRYRSK